MTLYFHPWKISPVANIETRTIRCLDIDYQPELIVIKTRQGFYIKKISLEVLKNWQDVIDQATKYFEEYL